MSKPFPRKSVVWSGAILGGIISAAMSARGTLFACFRNWDRNHYVLNGMDGREGLITFAGGHWFPDAPLVGVFHDIHSDRFRPEAELDLEQFFQGCPKYQRSLADQVALQHLQLEFHEKILHRVTTAFWDEGEYLAAADPWDDVLANGANLLDEELMEDRETIFAQLRMSMSPDQVAVIRSLFERKISRPAPTIKLTLTEVRLLESMFQDPKAMYMELAQLQAQAETTTPEGGKESVTPDLSWLDSLDSTAEAHKAMKLCRELFAEIGIIVPEPS